MMDFTQQDTWVVVGVALTTLVQVYKLFVKNPKSEQKADRVAEDVATVTSHMAALARELTAIKQAMRGK
jgi:outer membrane murein-binding lipoprotein Lpp